jgi:uncharacterized protein YndB with AHSA1/START domain
MTTEGDPMYGTVQQVDDGRWQLRFTRTLPHPADKVWRAITEPEQLAKWFPTTIEGERTTGAALRYSFPGGQAPPMDGEMLAFEPGSVMELRWGPDALRMELRAVPEGTEFTLLHTFEERGKAARDAAGWHVCLDALVAALGGSAVSPGDMAAWGEVHPRYVESFGPEAATIGPPQRSG